MLPTNFLLGILLFEQLCIISHLAEECNPMLTTVMAVIYAPMLDTIPICPRDWFTFVFQANSNPLPRHRAALVFASTSELSEAGTSSNLLNVVGHFSRTASCRAGEVP